MGKLVRSVKPSANTILDHNREWAKSQLAFAVIELKDYVSLNDNIAATDIQEYIFKKFFSNNNNITERLLLNMAFTMLLDKVNLSDAKNVINANIDKAVIAVNAAIDGARF